MAPNLCPHPSLATYCRRRRCRCRLLRSSRRTFFLLLGTLTLLTLCIFILHLPSLHQVLTASPGLSSSPSYDEDAAGGSGFLTSLGRMLSGLLPPWKRGNDEYDDDRDNVQLPPGKTDKDKDKIPALIAYGTHNHPPYSDDPITIIADLPREHIPVYHPPSGSPTSRPGNPPGNDPHPGGRRLVIVSDVHANLSPLKELLHKIGFDTTKGDHLVLVGDMIAKGPDSKGVLDLVMSLNASAVRGNHEDKVLAAAREIGRLKSYESLHVQGDAMEAERRGDVSAQYGKKHAHRIAKELTKAQLQWLRSLPLILRIGALPDAGEDQAPWNASTLVVVHAGLVPGVPLERQDPWAVMNMRSLTYPGRKKHIKLDGKDVVIEEGGDGEVDGDVLEETYPHFPAKAVAVPVAGREGEPWSHAWNRHQNHLSPSKSHILAIYGHDAGSGLQVDPEVDISPYHPKPKHNKKNRKFRRSLNQPPSLDGFDDKDEDSAGDRLLDRRGVLKDGTSASKHKKQNKKIKERGLRYAFGIDSGCGNGKKLTALIIDVPEEGVIRHRIEQVHCS